MKTTPIPFDEDRACAEGWGLFDTTDGYGAPRYEIHREDESPTFGDDLEARAFVLNSAMDGSQFHRDALAVVLGLHTPAAVPADPAPQAYFPAHLRAPRAADEAQQQWTVKVDQEADALFRTLPEAEIRRRQDICQAQARTAYEQKNERASLDIARQEQALMREMLRRC